MLTSYHKFFYYFGCDGFIIHAFCLLSTREHYRLTAQNITRHFISQCFTLVNNVYLLTKAQNSMLYGIMVPICSSDICGKIVSSWHRNSGPVTCQQDGHQGNTNHQSCSTLDRTQRHVHFSNTLNFP